VQSTGAIPNMPIFERSIFQPRWITELQIKRVLKGNRFIGVVSAKDSDPKKRKQTSETSGDLMILSANCQTANQTTCILCDRVISTTT